MLTRASLDNKRIEPIAINFDRVVQFSDCDDGCKIEYAKGEGDEPWFVVVREGYNYALELLKEV